jgi:hypothetical protein
MDWGQKKLFWPFRNLNGIIKMLSTLANGLIVSPTIMKEKSHSLKCYNTRALVYGMIIVTKNYRSFANKHSILSKFCKEIVEH